ncbi:hypothetical protein NLU14_06605 [Marinobacter sp. 71-i]|uniref:Uncharacterized protein n=1 Tax=Marinobacter iranensis TaxID=2962607 RepID=A0ABT5Y8A3_9GAMM|nr:hypothetical protein [Marinobacter iranensis]MDF0749897.1 hypothetical protein [Marinobacter iranensis]
MTDQEVVKAALEVWHQGYVPTLSGLPLEERRLAGYLVDRLSRFNCLSAAQKKELQAVASEAKANLPERVSRERVDGLARSWGLDYDLRPFMKALLPFQTRHYKRGLDKTAA